MHRQGEPLCSNIINITACAGLCKHDTFDYTVAIIEHVDLNIPAPTMGARPHLHTRKAKKCVPSRPTRLHGSHDQEGARTIIKDGAETPDH